MTLIPSLYGILAVSRVSFQMLTAHFARKREYPVRNLPAASLLLPVYNENPRDFYKCLASMQRQTYPNLQVIVIDDGSRNSAQIKRITNMFHFKYVYQPNAGKREAMYTGMKYVKPDSHIIFTADSDTVWFKDAAVKLAYGLLSRKNIGAVTGEVAVLNANTNLLTRLIAIRYQLAFIHERASQSLFGVVTCVSGPLGAYRRDVFHRIKEDFIEQRFMGKRCTYGDDRHLTNLVLNEGYKVEYIHGAKCLTNVPVTFGTLIKQQTRWSKSFWREMLWGIRVIPKHGLFMLYDWLITVLLPFVLLYTIVYHMRSIIDGSLIHVAFLIGTIIGMSLFRVIEPLVRTRKPIYLLYSCYAFIYFAVMLPSKFYALVTINDGKWGTR